MRCANDVQTYQRGEIPAATMTPQKNPQKNKHKRQQQQQEKNRRDGNGTLTQILSGLKKVVLLPQPVFLLKAMSALLTGLLGNSRKGSESSSAKGFALKRDLQHEKTIKQLSFTTTHDSMKISVP